MTAATLMVQGTASDVGKSILVTGLCRLFRRHGLRVAPFKAQNMALNAFVTPEGHEIGRAQATQAEAAGIAPHVDMNPLLLKPEGDSRSQIVLRGKPLSTWSAQRFYQERAQLKDVVLDSLNSLRERFDVVVIEGAGSPAEINLRRSDLVNMFIAHAAEAPVLLVADIDRGGVFASLLGTLDLLTPADRARVKGLVVNKFRGDPALFEDGVTMLQERSGLPVLGVVPHLRDLAIADEDSVAIDHRSRQLATDEQLDVAVVRLPRMSNHDDVLPLEHVPDVRVRFVEKPGEVGDADLVIVPGSKATRADLSWLRQRGFDQLLYGRVGRRQPVWGICGGCQMLGKAIEDPRGVEGPPGSSEGLGLLDLSTVFADDKTTAQVTMQLLHAGFFGDVTDLPSLKGYEIHMGHVTRGARGQAFGRLHGRDSYDGSVDPSGTVVGTLVHGLLEEPALCERLIEALWQRRGRPRPVVTTAFDREGEYDRLADQLQQSLDLPALFRLIHRPLSA